MNTNTKWVVIYLDLHGKRCQPFPPATREQAEKYLEDMLRGNPELKGNIHIEKCDG